MDTPIPIALHIKSEPVPLFLQRFGSWPSSGNNNELLLSDDGQVPKRCKNELLLPDDGQEPKRCKNNGTGSDVMCSAMGMGVSTRILFTGSLSPSSKKVKKLEKRLVVIEL